MLFGSYLSCGFCLAAVVGTDVQKRYLSEPVSWTSIGGRFGQVLRMNALPALPKPIQKRSTSIFRYTKIEARDVRFHDHNDYF